MGRIAELTDGGLPIVRVFNDNRGVFLPNWPTADGSNQTSSIWKMWTDAELNAVGYARFTDVPITDPNMSQTAPVDDFTDGKVTRTYTGVLRNVDVLKNKKKVDVLGHRRGVAAGGITFATKPFATDSSAMNDINLISNALNAGETFPGGTIPWDTLDNDVLDANETQFLAFAKAVAAHRIKATKAAKAHTDAVEALTTSQEVVDYDLTADIVGSEWPENPVEEI
tara:strand:+ start:98 stop:772 length:675 start_codon:yes stop_codon:yes gene_type:complete